MMDPRTLDQYGTPFWVSFDLNTASGTTDIVVPKPIVSQPSSISGGGHQELSGIVITGIHWTMRSGGAGQGFTLQALDYQIGGPSGVAVPIVEHLVSGAGDFSESISCFLPLSRANVPASSPSAGVREGAKVQVVGVQATSGHLIVEGFHTTHSFGKNAGSGSPQVFD